MLISVHVPKTAGTSMLHALRNHFGPTLLEDYSDHPGNPLSIRNIDPHRYFNTVPQIGKQVRCIHGHFHPLKYRTLSGAVRVTFLRHPIDRLISLFFFWQTRPRPGNSLHEYVLDNRLDIIAMARLPLLRWLLSRTYFGGMDMAMFDFIGFHDRREEDLLRFTELTGIAVSSNLHLRRTSEAERAMRDAIENDAALRVTLANILADDIRFYERLRERW
jgi:hypothetical protein